MELATRLTVTVTDSQADAIDLRSIGKCVEAAMAQVTFTAREIEGVLALDDRSWQSLSRMGDD